MYTQLCTLFSILWTEEILHRTTLDGCNPIKNGISHLSTGAGFLPFTFPDLCFQTVQDVDRMSSISHLSNKDVFNFPGFFFSISWGIFHVHICQWPRVAAPRSVSNRSEPRAASACEGGPEVKLKWQHAWFIYNIYSYSYIYKLNNMI